MNPNLMGQDLPLSFQVAPAVGLTWHYVTSGIGVVLLIWVIYHAISRRDFVPLAMYVGGLILSVNDPLYNHLFHIRYADNMPGPAFVGWGIATPGFMPLAYAGFSILGYWIYLAFRRGVTIPQVFMLWAGVYGIDVLFEGVPASLGAFTFDGRQPLEFSGWGYYLGWINATGFMSIGWLLCVLVPKLHGWHRLMLLPVPMIGHLGSGFCMAWPIFLALNWDVSVPVAWALGCASLFLSVVFAWEIAAMVAKPKARAL